MKLSWHFLPDTLTFDPVQAPSLRHAFELVNAAILEADSRLRHQILDRARDEDFAGTRFRGDARADVKRETKHLSPAHFVFTRVQFNVSVLSHPCGSAPWPLAENEIIVPHRNASTAPINRSMIRLLIETIQSHAASPPAASIL
jgi:hypothetical protein